VHLVGGIAGSILLGVLAQRSVNPGVVPNGLLFGDAAFFGKQIVAVLAVLAFSFIVSYLLARLVDRVIGLRVDDDTEVNGLDIVLHEERAYIFGE
jgi:Amt family ammonium transporter